MKAVWLVREWVRSDDDGDSELQFVGIFSTEAKALAFTKGAWRYSVAEVEVDRLAEE